MGGDHRHNRQRIEQATVHQYPVALAYRGKQARDGCRGAHGLMQAALLEPDFLLIAEVRGDRSEGDRQSLDTLLADDLTDPAEYPFTADRAHVAESDIQQANHVQVIEPGDPFAIFCQLAGGIHAAYHGAHGTPGNAVDLVTATFQLLYHPDMGITPRSATSQYQRHSLRHRVSCCISMSIDGASRSAHDARMSSGA